MFRFISNKWCKQYTHIQAMCEWLMHVYCIPVGIMHTSLIVGIQVICIYSCGTCCCEQCYFLLCTSSRHCIFQTLHLPDIASSRRCIFQTLHPPDVMGTLVCLICIAVASFAVLAQPAVAHGANTTLPLTYPQQVLQGDGNQICPSEEQQRIARSEVRNAIQRLLNESVIPLLQATQLPTEPITEPTTEPPTTQLPTTQLPTTQPPTTQPPTTQPPTTQPPTIYSASNSHWVLLWWVNWLETCSLPQHVWSLPTVPLCVEGIHHPTQGVWKKVFWF